MRIQEAIGRLRERDGVPLFVSEVWDKGLDIALRDAGPAGLFAGMEIRDPHMAACAAAGLHLWNDGFTHAHNLSQGITTPTGSYWHGLCHRREGHQGEGLEANLRNAKYWFRQTGLHPVFDAVYRSALGVLDGGGSGFSWPAQASDQLRAGKIWRPDTFIDWAAEADAQALPTEAQAMLEEMQWREMALLVDWCLEQAAGG